MRIRCMLKGHVWFRDVIGIYLFAGSKRERQCDIVECYHCGKLKISFADYPPRRMPRYPANASVPVIPQPQPSRSGRKPFGCFNFLGSSARESIDHNACNAGS